jgi:PAS domain S-box-containing protein
MTLNNPDNKDSINNVNPERCHLLDRVKRQTLASDIRWGTLFREVGDPIIIGDEEGILVCNPSFEKLTGLTSEQILGYPISHLPMCDSHPEDCSLFIHYWKDSTHTGKRFSWSFTNTQNKRIVLDMQIVFVIIEGNAFRFCIGRDITRETELLEEQEISLRQINKNMAQLAALNDEIRNPLTLIAMSAGMNPGPEQKKILEGVHMINSLVDRLDQGFTESEKVRKFLQRTIHDFGPALEEE